MNAKTMLAYGALVLLAVFALFYNLGDRLLWGDEAETALLAANITKFGVPKVTDGKNYITLMGRGHDSNKNHIWVWSPWLDEYVTAASFYLFGKSTFAARFPFVLIGLFSVLSLALIAHRIYRNHELTILVLLLCVTNVSFLLHARQCRYYAVVILAQIWLVYGYERLISGQLKRGGFYLVFALAVQFYCNYIVVLGNVLGLCISTALVYRRNPRLLRSVLICLAGFAVVTVPWLAYAQPWHQSKHIGLHSFGTNIFYYLSEVHFHIVPLVLLLIPPIGYFLNWRRPLTHVATSAAKDTEILLWMLIPSQLLILGAAPGNYFRYIVPLVPVLILLASVILVYYLRPRVVRYLLIVVLCLSNVIAVFSAYPFRGLHTVSMPFVQFIREITSSYEDRLEDVVSYLRENAEPDESLFVFDPEFPLIFYSGMRVIDARFSKGLNVRDLPDWIFTESASGVFSYPPMQLPKPLLRYYKSVTLTVHDTPRNGCRPAPDVHTSFTSAKLTKMVIYKKVR